MKKVFLFIMLLLITSNSVFTQQASNAAKFRVFMVKNLQENPENVVRWYNGTPYSAEYGVPEYEFNYYLAVANFYNYIFMHGGDYRLLETKKSFDSVVNFDIENDIYDIKIRSYLFLGATFLFKGGEKEISGHIYQHAYNTLEQDKSNEYYYTSVYWLLYAGYLDKDSYTKLYNILAEADSKAFVYDYIKIRASTKKAMISKLTKPSRYKPSSYTWTADSSVAALVEDNIYQLSFVDSATQREIAKAEEAARLEKIAKAQEEARLAEEAQANNIDINEQNKQIEMARSEEINRYYSKINRHKTRLGGVAIVAGTSELDEIARAEEQARLDEIAKAEEQARLDEIARAEEQARLDEIAKAEEHARLDEIARAEEQARLDEIARAEEEEKNKNIIIVAPVVVPPPVLAEPEAFKNTTSDNNDTTENVTVKTAPVYIDIVAYDTQMQNIETTIGGEKISFTSGEASKQVDLPIGSQSVEIVVGGRLYRYSISIAEGNNIYTIVIGEKDNNSVLTTSSGSHLFAASGQNEVGTSAATTYTTTWFKNNPYSTSLEIDRNKYNYLKGIALYDDYIKGVNTNQEILDEARANFESVILENKDDKISAAMYLAFINVLRNGDRKEADSKVANAMMFTDENDYLYPTMLYWRLMFGQLSEEQVVTYRERLSKMPLNTPIVDYSTDNIITLTSILPSIDIKMNIINMSRSNLKIALARSDTDIKAEFAGKIYQGSNIIDIVEGNTLLSLIINATAGNNYIFTFFAH